MYKALIILTVGLFLFGCQTSQKIQKDAQKFLNEYAGEYQALYYASALAEWQSNTVIIDGDSTNAIATRKANEELAAFTGSNENIEKIQYYLNKEQDLTDIQVRQLKAMLYSAANNPQIVSDLVKERIKAETEQNEKLFGFDYQIDGNSVSTNTIDEILRLETDLKKRLETWEVSKEVGIHLKSGLTNLQGLRNQTVQALGYDDYFTYQISEYGMTTEEMLNLNHKLIREIWPLYRELHTYARYKLAEKYNMEEVPDLLPAHWLPNRWGQDWSSLVTVEGLDLDGILQQKTAEWIIRQGERFYISLGFPELPQSFWEKSSLYPLPPDADYKKNNHASAWHLDLDKDVRNLMSVIPNSEWYETSHHELGHIYYYIAYTNPEVPLILRTGANRGFHEAMGSLMGLASMQKPFLSHLDLLPADSQTDETMILLKEALNYIVFMPWSAGVMTDFEHQLYTNRLPADQYNQKWWELKKKYQGIIPPTPRDELFCDAASKTHINNDAAQYYDYALSYALLFQFHDYISKEILHQDPHSTNYYGNKKVGEFIKKLTYPGASRDWRQLLLETIGQEMSAKAMVNYFEPLMGYLKKENKNRKYTLPETI